MSATLSKIQEKISEASSNIFLSKSNKQSKRRNIQRVALTSNPKGVQLIASQSQFNSENFFFKTDIQSLAKQKGPPRFFSYLPSDPSLGQKYSSLPILIYVPGMDGTGGAAFRQFQMLESNFQICCYSIPNENRCTFEQQVEYLKVFIEGLNQLNEKQRPIYILAESLGCLTALALLVQNSKLVDRLILVNPALNIKETPWPFLTSIFFQLDDSIYKNVLPYLMLPIVCQPLRVVERVLQGDEMPQNFIQFRDLLLNMLKDVELIPALIEKDNLRYKLEILLNGNEYLEKQLQKITVRTLAIVSEQDNMVKSYENGEFLSKNLLSCQVHKMVGHGHILMNEANVDVNQIIFEENFYLQERKLSSSNNGYIGSGTNFGTSRPVEIPSKYEYDQVYDKQIKSIKDLVSPKFYSVNMQGIVGEGISHSLQAIPNYKERPVVFVGNHQVTAQDMYIIIDQIRRDLDVFVRPLGHPVLFQQGIAQLNEFFRTVNLFGGVKLNAMNYASLLKQNEKMLIYPGGVSEVFQYRNLKYQVCWPDQPEFIQLAARYNAIVIPFAAVGAEDSVQIIQRVSTIKSVPLIGGYLDKLAEDNNLKTTPVLIEGLSADDERNKFDYPVLAPTGKIDRFYFLFGKPYDLMDLNPKDNKTVLEVYQQIKGAVQNGIRTLRLCQSSDPYRNFDSRYPLERLSNFKYQAPTFNLQTLQSAYSNLIKL